MLFQMAICYYYILYYTMVLNRDKGINIVTVTVLHVTLVRNVFVILPN